MAPKKQKLTTSKVFLNRKASFRYFIEDKFSAGIVLQGTEIKSIRAGKAQIDEAFVRFSKGEAFLYNASIEAYDFGSDQNHPATRPRKLLLHHRENKKLQEAITLAHKVVIPLKLYFSGALAKIEIAIAQGKKLHDKRTSLHKKTLLRETERMIKQTQFIKQKTS